MVRPSGSDRCEVSHMEMPPRYQFVMFSVVSLKQ